MENEGSPGSTGGHFDGRAYGNELMTGRTMANSLTSKITLAFFQDSG
ncbi:unnamed protein product [Trichobilharzia regenti]|nr:unnamed protein product [Trichobilharzia regenti]